MAKIKDPAAEQTWQELGMKPGIRVPGTNSWMERWKESPSQGELVRHAQKVELLHSTMSGDQVNRQLKKYLSGKWGPEDEPAIAAAIRLRPAWLNKYNQMEVHLMEKKKEKAAKAVRKKAEGASIKMRIESLEEEVGELKKTVANLMGLIASIPGAKTDKKGKKKKEESRTEASPSDGEVKALLKDLEKAKKEGDKKEAFKIRVKLRKAGYSLRTNGMK